MFDELLLKSRGSGKSVYAFSLEYPGTPGCSLEPYTLLELSTVDSGPGFKNDEQTLQFWDRLTSNLKRLIALNPPRTATRSPTATAPQWSS
ncbi:MULTISPECIES: T6SS immunity protein Tli4 family protein [Pseudomonas]|jgi:hypothetical protein|uniref:T6SS immunity protein Tli4 family protein n=1 Tax=Pseudomonas TaxID=286 RepID=UPI000A086928|nr:hypothetical protein H040_04788 [Pseudomonas sp. URMO17WK12:I7]SMF64815.1 hypothetical protein SAMN02745903_04807 [Pseudomonas sp. URMO17WK12:I5]